MEEKQNFSLKWGKDSWLLVLYLESKGWKASATFLISLDVPHLPPAHTGEHSDVLLAFLLFNF